MLISIVMTSTTISAKSEEVLTQEERMQWWRDAKFGMFIHWGLYSVLGGEYKGADYGKECGGASAEWVMNRGKIPRLEYAKLAEQFNPTQFDAKSWVSMAKTAGMKYMVITSKHHDGFCLFDTKYTDYNVMDSTPFKRDIIKELADECARQGIRFGVYYSQYQDWYHRKHGSLKSDKPAMTESEYLTMVQNHLTELLTGYGDIALLWFDTGGSNVEEANRQGAMVRKLQPKTVICSRLYQRSVPEEKQIYADFESLADRTVATKRMDRDTETCMTMRHNWGYDRDDNNWKTAKDLIEQLVLSTSRGVNFLLNVGPTPEGTLCPEEIDRLKTIGAWIKIHGESIYGTDYAPLDFDFPWGCMTQKDNKLYLHVLKWDANGITFNGIKGTPIKAYLMAAPDDALPIEQHAGQGTTTVKGPSEAPDVNDSVIVMEYEGGIAIDKTAKGKYHWIKSSHVTPDGPAKHEKSRKKQ